MKNPDRAALYFFGREIVDLSDREVRLMHANIARNHSWLSDRGFPVNLGAKSPADFKNLSYLQLSLPETDCALRLLRGEIAKYPPEHLATPGLNRVRIGRDAFKLVNGVRQPLSGEVNVYGDMYLNFDSDCLGEFRKSVHHEAKHLVNFAGPKNYAPIGPNRRLTEKWVELSGGWSRYIGQRYWSMSNTDFFKADLTGFASVYGLVTPEEDDATVTEEIMENLGALLARSCQDPGLSEKIRIVKTGFWQRTQGVMGERYFYDLANGDVDEGYWQDGPSRSFASVAPQARPFLA